MGRAKLCGAVGGEVRRQLALDSSEAELFSKLVALVTTWCAGRP